MSQKLDPSPGFPSPPKKPSIFSSISLPENMQKTLTWKLWKKTSPMGRAPPPRELTWQGKIQSFEDVFPVENRDFPLSCKFIKGVPSSKLNLGRLEYPILNSVHTSSKNVQSPASVMLVDTRVKRAFKKDSKMICTTEWFYLYDEFWKYLVFGSFSW